MNSDLHDQVLDAFFWHFVDRGDPPADTPLFKGIYRGDLLTLVIARAFGLSPREAEAIIEIARREVAL
jgi:hypothetical protein